MGIRRYKSYPTLYNLTILMIVMDRHLDYGVWGFRLEESLVQQWVPTSV